MESILFNAFTYVSGNANAKNTLLFSDIFHLFPDSFQHISPQFKNDYRLVFYSDSGFFDDNKNSGLRHSSMTGYADDLIRYLEHNGIHNIIYMAHSANALLAIMAAAKAPHLFSKIVFTSAAACLLPCEETRHLYEPFSSHLDDLFHCLIQKQTDVQPNQTVQFRDVLRTAFAQLTREKARAVFELLLTTDCRNYLDNFPIPTVILQVAADKLATNEAGYAMYRSIPDSQLVRIKAKGQLHLVQSPEEIVKAMKVFIPSRSF